MARDDSTNKRSRQTSPSNEERNNLPPDAQELYDSAKEKALEDYKQWSTEERQTTADRVAWAAVREEFEKREDGRWHRRDTGHVEEG